MRHPLGSNDQQAVPGFIRALLAYRSVKFICLHPWTLMRHSERLYSKWLMVGCVCVCLEKQTVKCMDASWLLLVAPSQTGKNVPY